ncbi:MAG: MFS transporter [Peptococcaceae bacterium]|nr:MFS transporter [Peptococcaceae bacterium]
MNQPQEIAKAKLWTKNFILIMLANAFVFISFHMLLPSMPIYVQHLGAAEDIVGLIMGIFTVTAVGLRPFAGRVLDTKGRKVVYFFGLTIIILSIFAYSLVSSVFMVLLIRLVHGIGWGASTTAAGTIATDVIPKQRLGEGMGFYGLTSVISMAIAPVIGLQVIQSWGFTYLFVISAFLAVLGAIFASFIKYQKINPPQVSNTNKAKPALFEKSAYKPAVVVFFITLTYGAVVSFIALYAAEFKIENIGIFFTVYALTLLISRPLFGKVADKKGFDFTIIPGTVCVGLTMIVLFFAHNLYFFLAAAIIYGIGFGAVQPSLQAMAVFDVPPQRRGAANGTFMSGFDLGIGVGSMIWGVTAKFTGYSTMYLLAVIPVIIAFSLYLYLGKTKAASTL